jgi:hypothetical protein
MLAAGAGDGIQSVSHGTSHHVTSQHVYLKSAAPLASDA